MRLTLPLLLLALPLAAQAPALPRGNSEVRGLLFGGPRGLALPGALIHLKWMAGRDTIVSMQLTDRKGQFRFEHLPVGQYEVSVHLDTLPPASRRFELQKKERMDIEMSVWPDGGQVQLPALEANVPFAETGHRGFDQRRQTGDGRYITREYIEARNPATLTDLFRTVPGMRTTCQGGVCTTHMSRSPRDCPPAWFLDGIPATPNELNLTPPSDVAGIEIYSGPAEVPPEFSGVRARCGAIVVWTRFGKKPR